MENFIKKAEKWLEIYGSGENLSSLTRMDLNIKFKDLQREYENLGDLRSFVREVYWEVSSRYLKMPKPNTIKKPISVSIRSGARD